MCMIICLIASIITILSNKGRLSILSLLYSGAFAICFIQASSSLLSGGAFIDTSLSSLFNGVLIVLNGVALQLVLEIGLVQFLRRHYTA